MSAGKLSSTSLSHVMGFNSRPRTNSNRRGDWLAKMTLRPFKCGYSMVQKYRFQCQGHANGANYLCSSQFESHAARTHSYSRFWFPIHPAYRSPGEGIECLFRNHTLESFYDGCRSDVKRCDSLGVSPHSVRDEDAPRPRLDAMLGQVPCLGSATVHSILAQTHGGSVEASIPENMAERLLAEVKSTDPHCLGS